MTQSKISIEFVKEFCKSNNYICLSTSYIRGKDKLDLICPKGHSCSISFNNFYHHNRRCGRCANKGRTIDDIKVFCNNIGWKCLANEYKDCTKLMLFECPDGHQTLKPFRSLTVGKDCTVCLKLEPPTIEEVISYCKVIGFKCLSTEYKTAKDKLHLECINDHKFYQTWDKLKQGRGCSYCNTSKFENRVRYIVEELIGSKFPKMRPEFLKYPKTGRKLELDIFNEELKLAIECQGPQHFSIIKLFKMNEKSLKNYKERDAFKKEMCDKLGIKLIYINYEVFDSYNYPIKLKEQIINILTENNIYFENKNIVPELIMKAGNI